jgi:zinc protease
MKKYSTLLALAFLLFSTNSPAQTTPPPAPEKVTSVEGITEYKLANGLRVLMFPDQSKSTITVNITYLVGSRMEGYGETGMAHLLEHMVFKGSPRHPNIPQELTAHGASPNGTTWYDRTNYFETFAATDENLNWALDLESDRMVNSFIKNEDLQTEFSVVRNEFEMGENDPAGVIMERIYSTAYLWHNYGKSTIGSREDIEKVPIENLKAFYQKYYQPDNAVLTVTGKIDEQKTLALVNKYFGVIPRPSRKLQEPYTVEPVQDGERSVTLRRVGDIQVTACGYHICQGWHTDYAATDILQEVLTNAPSGRLYKALVETKKATEVSGFSLAMKDPGYMYFSAKVLKEKSVKDAERTMLNLIDSLKYYPVTEEETKRAKDNILKYYNMVYNNSDYIGTLLSEFIAQGDWRLLFVYRDRIEKVKAEDVNRVIATYYKPSNRTTGLFIPEASPDRAYRPPVPELAVMMKDYKGKEALAQAETFDASCTNIDNLTQKGKLTGGAQYALLPKSTRGNVVKLKININIGTEASLKNMSEVSYMTAAMLKNGTKSKTREQINDALSNIKSEINVSGEGQKVVVTLESTKENFNAALGILREILREPSFPSNEFDKLKQKEIADIDQQKGEPQSIAFNEIQRLTKNYDPSDFRYSKTFEEQSASVSKVTLDNVKKFYTDFYNGTHATIAVVGDFDKSTIVKDLDAILGNWTSTEKYVYAAGKFYDAPVKKEKINTPDKTNAMLAAGMNLELKDDNADFPALIMGNFILGGGFLNSRLSTRIRQKEGISYGVGSWLRAGELDSEGTFGSYAIYNPENSEKLLAAYREELDRFLKDGLTESELKDAKSGFLQSRVRNRSNDDYLVERLTRNLILDRSMKWDEQQENAVDKLTADQIKTAMNKWVKPEKIIIVEAGEFDKKKN